MNSVKNLILFLLFLPSVSILLGCEVDQKAVASKLKSDRKTVALKLEPSTTLSPQNLDSSWASHERLGQILKLESGEILGITHQWGEPKDYEARLSWGFRVFDRSTNQFGDFQFVTDGSRFSNLEKTAPNQFRFFDEFRFQEREGQIISAVTEFQYDFSTAILSQSDEKLFEWGAFSTQQPENLTLGREGTLDLRLAFREVYEESLLIPKPSQLPIQNSGLLLVEDDFESIGIQPSDQKSYLLRMLSSDLHRNSEVTLCVGGHSQSNHIIRSTRQRSGEKLSLELLKKDQNNAFQIVLSDTIDAPASFSLNSCKRVGNQLYFTGALRLEPGGKAQVWVARYPSERAKNSNALDFEIYDSQSNSIPHVIDYWASQDLVVVGGKTNFGQAATGSVSDGDGLVLFISPDLKSGSQKVIHGDRSTYITAMLTDENTLYVGGVTNAPSTHSRWQGASVFIQQINQDNVMYKK